MVGRYYYDRFSTTNAVKMHVFTFSRKLSGTRLKSCVLGTPPRIGGWGLQNSTLGETNHTDSASGSQLYDLVKIKIDFGPWGYPRVGQYDRGTGHSKMS